MPSLFLNLTYKIIDILKHDNGKGKKAEQIRANMIDSNTYDVDAISGATTSSEVIKSAVSNALVEYGIVDIQPTMPYYTRN